MLVQLLPVCCMRIVPLGLNLKVDHGGATNRLNVACYTFGSEMITSGKLYNDLRVTICSYCLL